MTTRLSVDTDRLKPLPAQTTDYQRPSTAPHRAPLSSSRPQTPRQPDGTPERDGAAASGKSGHQRFVLTDPVAFRYLEEDASTTVLERKRELRGYECFIVEQWTTSRNRPTFVITTFTGDPSHVVVVGVLSVPTDESTWSPRLRVYFKALNQNHARRRETPLGIIMVTNLSSFPSSLTVIPVPGGDLTQHRSNFFVNEDLKRLGCSGRMGLTLASPAAATVAKFHQLYRTSDKNETYKSVIELVKLCQSALMLFDKLEVDYADGLLCDVTERAVNDWWMDIGTEQYNLEPHDGILGPTTVAGLLGLLMGARNRLHAVSMPVGKDAFDVEAMKRGIGAFQKQQRMERTRRLDRKTLIRLHKATQKAADKERWAVPKAVKSTVAELSGKGGDFADGFGIRDRAGIAEIETVDIDRFIQLIYGQRCKWLWLGKPLKRSKGGDAGDHTPKEGQEGAGKGLIFKADEHGGFAWTTGRKSTVDSQMLTKSDREREQEYQEFLAPANLDEHEDSDDTSAKPGALKRTTRTGIGMVKGAVNFRGHRPKQSVDEPGLLSPVEEKTSSRKRPLIFRSHTSPTSNASSPKSPDLLGRGVRQDTATTDQSHRLNAALIDQAPDMIETRSILDQRLDPVASQESLPFVANDRAGPHNGSGDGGRHRREISTESADSPVTGSVYHGVDLNEALPSGPGSGADASLLLRRTTSYSQYVATQLQRRPDEQFPRHLSFSLAEESVLDWQSLPDGDEDPFTMPAARKLTAQLSDQQHLAKEAQQLRSLIAAVQVDTAAWTREQLRLLDIHQKQIDEEQEKLEKLYHPRLDEVHAVQAHSHGILRQEKGHIEEGVKEIETLAAKLEYEVNSLAGKVEDVEAGVIEFEKGVIHVEDRVGELERAGEQGSRWRCQIQ